MELLARFGQYGARSTLLKREKDESVVKNSLFGARREFAVAPASWHRTLGLAGTAGGGHRDLSSTLRKDAVRRRKYRGGGIDDWLFRARVCPKVGSETPPHGSLTQVSGGAASPLPFDTRTNRYM